MTTEDDAFLRHFNQKRSSGKCSEDDFERIMEAFEDTAAEQAPFASIDNTVIPFETMQLALKQQVLPKVQVFAKDIYEYWKLRRQESGNTHLQPSLKFEKNQELDDGDPYVCFRRRDARQTRKTRNRDVQSTEKLKKLRKELEDGRDLVGMAYSREVTKRDLLKIDKDIFEQRVKVKDTKIKLGIKGDDDDLINQRVSNPSVIPWQKLTSLQPQKRKLNEFPQNQRPPGPQFRIPGRSDGRPLEADLIMLSELLSQKENLIRKEIEELSEAHRKWNTNHVDLTRAPLSPVDDHQMSFRPATAQYHYLVTPPSSVISDSCEQNSPSQESPETFTFRYASPPPEDEPRGQPAYRRRVGRGGRLWIDRRGMSVNSGPQNETRTDRWKYDQDDYDEQPVYELDPHDLKSLRFRSSIPFPSHLYPQRTHIAPNARAIGSSPVNNRVIAVQQQAPT